MLNKKIYFNPIRQLQQLVYWVNVYEEYSRDWQIDHVLDRYSRSYRDVLSQFGGRYHG